VGNYNQRGLSLSVFACGAILALLIMAGLVIDGSAQLLARQRAEDAAAQVARLAMDAAVPYMVDGRDGSGAALAAAGQAARRYDNMTFSFNVDSLGSLHVGTSTTVPTLFLCLVGVAHLQATGQAVATVFAP